MATYFNLGLFGVWVSRCETGSYLGARGSGIKGFRVLGFRVSHTLDHVQLNKQDLGACGHAGFASVNTRFTV